MCSFYYFFRFSLAYTLLFMCSCQTKLATPTKPSFYTPLLEGSLDLDQSKIQDFMVLLFPKNLKQEDWDLIMSSVKQLDLNKDEIQKLREFPRRTPKIDQQIEHLISQNIELLLGLAENKLTYLLSWSEIENCHWNKLELKCKPLYDIYGENPMNGGLPLPTHPAEYVSKPLTGTLEPASWLHMTLPLSKPNPQTSHYPLHLYLRPNGVNQYSGEVLLDEELWFERDGERVEVYPYGVAQMRVQSSSKE